MFVNAACSFSMLTVALAAWFWISPVCCRSICEVDSRIVPVVVFSAVTWSSTSRWLPSASAAITAVRSAATVVVVARSTPLTSSTLLRRIRSSAR